MLLLARAAARCGSRGSQASISAALWIGPLARVAKTSSADSVCSSADSVSQARSPPSVRRQHRGAEEDRQHQEREAGRRPAELLESLPERRGTELSLRIVLRV